MRPYRAFSPSAVRHGRRWLACVAGAPSTLSPSSVSVTSTASTLRCSCAPPRPPPQPAPAGHRAPAPPPRHERRRAQCRARLAAFESPLASPRCGEHGGALPVTGGLTGGELAAGQRPPLPGSLTGGAGQRLGPVCQPQCAVLGARARVCVAFRAE
jgi:hypothetical protein